MKIGVLSDSNDFLEDSIAKGELPADVTTLPGQDGRPGSGEGTAMLEIVHDLAPGAKLFFATAFASATSFADNIRALRAAGCDIIVDDIIYFSESPFQDGEIAKAVEDVTADGALYFSSAGNSGNANDGTSGVWEGDFKKAKSTIGALAGLGDVHDFGQRRRLRPNRARGRSHHPLLVGPRRPVRQRLRPLHPGRRAHHRSRRCHERPGRRRRARRVPRVRGPPRPPLRDLEV